MAYKSLGIDRVLEFTVTVPGTSAFTLAGAIAGYRTFGSILAVADTCPYYAEAVDASGIPTGQWERGFGTLTSAGGGPAVRRGGTPLVVTSTGTFTRSTVLDGSSGAGVTVNFTANVRIGIAPMSDVAMMYPAPGGRLTLASGSPVGDSTLAGSTTIYYVPHLHDKILIWNGTGLQIVQFSSPSISITGIAAGTALDVFGYIGAGGLTLELLTWTNNTTRTLPTYQNGFLCKSTDATRRYLGSVYVSSVGTSFDYSNGGASAGGKRFLWNMYNRVPKYLTVSDSTATWSYATATWVIYRGVAAPTNCLEIFRGLNDDAMSAMSTLNGGAPSSTGFFHGIGVSGASPAAPSSVGLFYNGVGGGSVITGNVTSFYNGTPGTGYCYFAPMVLINGTPAVNFGASGYGAPSLNANVFA